jgi:uncharacterized phiE125 gp8 family phage protein
MLEYQITTQPAIEPVTLDEAKLNLRVDCTADDALITALIVAARRWCEQYENRAYITQTITAKTFWLLSEIILPLPLLQSVTSITYVDLAGDTQTLSNTLYDVDTFREPGRVTRAFNATYPSVRGDINGVTIVYKAGYGDASTDVPQETIQAIQLFIAHLYENRVAVTEISMNTLPLGVKALLNKRVKTV